MVSVNCQSYRKSGLTVRKLQAVSDPGEGMGGAIRALAVVAALNTMSLLSPVSPPQIAAYFHHLPFREFICLRVKEKACTCTRTAVRLQGLRVRCKCAGTQLPRRQWGEEGGGVWGSKGVNWAVIVQEAGSDWVKWQDLVRSTWGTLTAFCAFYLSSIILFLFVDLQAFILDWAFEM